MNVTKKYIIGLMIVILSGFAAIIYQDVNFLWGFLGLLVLDSLDSKEEPIWDVEDLEDECECPEGLIGHEKAIMLDIMIRSAYVMKALSTREDSWVNERGYWLSNELRELSSSKGGELVRLYEPEQLKAFLPEGRDALMNYLSNASVPADYRYLFLLAAISEEFRWTEFKLNNQELRPVSDMNDLAERYGLVTYLETEFFD